jgi:hypothetical protein
LLFFILNLKKLKLEIETKLRLEKRIRSALSIQAWYRCHREKRNYQLKIKSVFLIQNWIRSKKERLMYLDLKRNKTRLEIKIRAAIIIQRQWRFNKFKQQITKYRNTIITIQRWHR